jgi:cephalosporin-C deacetylase-like acetyl esterase
LSSKIPPAALKEILVEYRDYEKEQPVSDELFQICKSQYAYDKTPLNARIESTEESADSISIHQIISFDAAYGGERVTAHLYLPRKAKPPYQTVVFFPPNVYSANRSFPRENPPSSNFAVLLQSGRAVLWPEYKGTYSRWVKDSPLVQDVSWTAARPWQIQWYQDFARSVDYLQKRKDIIDMDKLGYLGGSWGAIMGLVNLSLDNRFKVAVLAYGGLSPEKVPLPELDDINFVTRVRVPVLMINSRNDPKLPYEKSQVPMFKLLGTPPENKLHRTYNVPGHGVPDSMWEKDMLSWFDKYLGKVR